MANVKQSLTEQLEQQYEQVQSANSTAAKLKQQLEDEVTESRATSSQLHAIRDVLSRGMAQQQDMVRQGSASASAVNVLWLAQPHSVLGMTWLGCSL